MIKPLGLLEPDGVRGFVLRPAELRPLVGQLPTDLRPLTAGYLRSGSIIIALMEYTTDVLDDSFTVAGGSGICSDGEYYWRVDMADYVERYGFRIPEQILRHMRAKNWHCPTLPEGEIARIYDELGDILRPR